MNDALLGGADQSRLGLRHGRECTRSVASGDGFLDLARRRAHARTPRFIDGGPAVGLAGGFLSGFGIGHSVLNTEPS